VAWEVECRKPPVLLCMGLKICLDEDLYRFLAGVHFHSDRVVAKIYLMPIAGRDVTELKGTIFSARGS
jgi:hypothetical protein